MNRGCGSVATRRLGTALIEWAGHGHHGPFIFLGTNMDTTERIKSTVEGSPIVLYMKGTPQFPMCGFSSRTVKVLKAVNAEFASVNVLEDPEVRANLPRYSNWPTFPQLFIGGELIGGCDIAIELYESGELERLVGDVQKG